MEIAEYKLALDKNTHEIISLAEECSVKELNDQRENKWSILGILEHIIMTDRIVLSLLLKPSTTVSEKNDLLGFEKLNRLMVDLRGRKIEAPEMLQPKGNIRDLEEFKKTFLEQRELLKNNISSGKIVIDNRIHKHPVLGEMAIRDWMNFIPLHARRHLDQAKDLLALIRKEGEI
jgi:hypothetical protein